MAKPEVLTDAERVYRHLPMMPFDLWRALFSACTQCEIVAISRAASLSSDLFIAATLEVGQETITLADGSEKSLFFFLLGFKDGSKLEIRRDGCRHLPG